jgi:16S rRNA (guanine966-N2)-methyltransferase
LRVIAGRLRGRPLHAPRGLTTRPTADRAREAIFQILGDLSGLHVLDCYAGTGAMGIEALSRGAVPTVFVDSHRGAARALEGNLERLGLVDQATLIETSIERARRRLGEHAPFDLVLSDPPWRISNAAAGLVVRTLHGLLAPGARVLLGHPAAAPVDVPDGLTRLDLRKWGGSGMSFCEISRDSSQLAPDPGAR